MDPSELDGIKEDVDYYIEVETNQGSLDIFHCIYLSPSTLLCFALLCLFFNLQCEQSSSILSMTANHSLILLHCILYYHINLMYLSISFTSHHITFALLY